MVLRTGRAPAIVTGAGEASRLLAAGVPAELRVFEAMRHGSFGGHAPEDKELRAEVGRFEQGAPGLAKPAERGYDRLADIDVDIICAGPCG